MADSNMQQADRDRARQLLLWTLNSILAESGTASAEMPNLSEFDEDDWTAFSKLVLVEGLPGVIEKSFPYQPDDFPRELSEAFSIFLENQRNSNQARTTEFISVMKELHSAGIRTMPFKGPALADRVYGDLGARSFWDFDFLFPANQIEKLTAMLDGLGFTNNLPDTLKQQKAYWSYSGQGVFILEETGLALEPHWAFVPKNLAIDLDYDTLWERSSRVEWRGIEINLLSPEDEFIMLALHGGKEAWSKIKYIFDFASFIKANPSLDWDYITKVSREKGVRRLINLGLTMVVETFPCFRDRTFALQQKDPRVDRLVARIKNATSTIAPGIYYFNPYYMQVRERIGDKLKYGIRTLFTPRAVHFGILRLPDSLFFLYLPFKVLYDGLILPTWILWKSVTGGAQPGAPSD